MLCFVTYWRLLDSHTLNQVFLLSFQRIRSTLSGRVATLTAILLWQWRENYRHGSRDRLTTSLREPMEGATHGTETAVQLACGRFLTIRTSWPDIMFGSEPITGTKTWQV